ncbi:unnamed protein product [Triticum turgidum subsp. durum]|uniref:SCP domain-containing protein n=1 Tax=Triticum turgidum subsp. durum TaxID=4567 RepID=A0A9R0U043_TRITD|nr:unnamed protein product [Triticum turgidum subsp. durum]
MAVTAQNSEQDFVDAHNAARADVGLGEVTWDATVAAFAQDYADQRRGDCQLVHSGGQYGENLYGGGGGGTGAIGCARVVCDSGDGVFIICSYNPPGNFPGVKKSSEMKVQNPVTSEVRKPWEMATSDLQ